MTQAMETEDFLAHYGVKGMRWGVRRERDSGGSGGGGGTSTKKPSRVGGAVDKIVARDHAIESARMNVKSMKNERKGAKRQIKSSTRVLSSERKAGRNQLRNMKMDILNHPDSATAKKMTSGEITANIILGNPGLIYGQHLAVQQHIERQQSGHYTAKKR